MWLNLSGWVITNIYSFACIDKTKKVQLFNSFITVSAEVGSTVDLSLSENF